MQAALPIERVNFAAVAPLHHQKVLQFVNAFVVETVQFLNRFSQMAEEKLTDVSRRVGRLEVTVTILESKLSSVPGLEGIGEEAPAPEPAAAPPAPPGAPAPAGAAPAAPAIEAPPAAPRAEDDPRYTRFLQMVKLGIDIRNILSQVTLAGLDPKPIMDAAAKRPGGMPAGIDMPPLPPGVGAPTGPPPPPGMGRVMESESDDEAGPPRPPGVSAPARRPGGLKDSDSDDGAPGPPAPPGAKAASGPPPPPRAGLMGSSDD